MTAGRRQSMGDCDRQPCPAANVGDQVSVEIDGLRQVRLGVPGVVEGRVVAVTPFLHALQVGNLYLGGHRSPDVVRRRA